MPIATTTRRARQSRERRVFLIVFVLSFLAAFSVVAWIYGPACLAYWNYGPREGDIVFQSLPPSRLVNTIEGVTRSPYSHCGIVAKKNGSWVVYEAYHNVEATPLRTFLFRGRNQAFAVYRLKPAYIKQIPAIIDAVQAYEGRPYDVRYRMDDDAIYCSELIYKAFQTATDGEELGVLTRLGDLNWKPFRASIEYFEKGPVPLDRFMITPRDMAMARQLERVYAHRIPDDQP